MSSLLFFPSIFAFLIFVLILTGILISLYWKWFIIPIFNVKPITIPQGLGLSLFISVFSSSIKSSDKNPLDSAIPLLIQFSFYFIAGYILQFFIKNNYNN